MGTTFEAGWHQFVHLWSQHPHWQILKFDMCQIDPCCKDLTDGWWIHIETVCECIYECIHRIALLIVLYMSAIMWMHSCCDVSLIASEYSLLAFIGQTSLEKGICSKLISRGVTPVISMWSPLLPRVKSHQALHLLANHFCILYSPCLPDSWCWKQEQSVLLWLRRSHWQS